MPVSSNALAQAAAAPAPSVLVIVPPPLVVQQVLRRTAAGGLATDLPSRGAPAAEDEPANCEPEAERAERERPDRDELPPERQTLPPADRLFFLDRERFSAALFACSSAGSKTEIDVVEQLWRLIRHDASV